MTSWESKPAALTCQSVSKAFGGVVAVDDIAVRLPVGGCAAIVGPNGSGKSTLLNILTGFISADAGRYFAGELEITGMSPWRIVRAGVARTFQEVRVIRSESVLENVKLASRDAAREGLLRSLASGLGFHRDAGEEAKARLALEFVGLLELAAHNAGELSVGQQKLLNVACCIGTGAAVLLLDEPVAGVSPALSLDISARVRGLVEMGKSVVFVEHDMDFTRATADWIYVMAEGRLVAQGTPQDILARREIVELFLG